MCAIFSSGAGPKTYALAIRNTVTGEERKHIRAKGIKANQDTATKLTFESMVEIVRGRQFYVNQATMKRCKKTGTIRSVSSKKICRSTYSKRIRLADDYRTLPWGWVDCDENVIHKY